MENIQETIVEITENLENLSLTHSNLKDSLDIFLLIDQMYLKVIELHSSLETLIQDLVLANSGHITSTLLPITQLMKVIHTAKENWNFMPFFNNNNIAMYYRLLTSYLNRSSGVIDISFSSELKYNIYKHIPFPMKFNNSVLKIDTPLVDPLNYIL